MIAEGAEDGMEDAVVDQTGSWGSSVSRAGAEDEGADEELRVA